MDKRTDKNRVNQNDLANKQNQKEKENKSLKRTITTILIIIIIILLLLSLKCCGSMMGGSVDVNPTQPTVDLQVDPNAGEYVPPETTAPSKGVAIPGWGTLTIPANTTENIVVDFYNPELNDGLYYLTFELRLPDNSEKGYEVLYTSGLVEPGLHIQKINLNRGLDAGIYQAYIHVQPYRMDENKTPTNNADLKTELVVR